VPLQNLADIVLDELASCVKSSHTLARIGRAILAHQTYEPRKGSHARLMLCWHCAIDRGLGV